MTAMVIKINFDVNEGGFFPHRSTKGAAGYDVIAPGHINLAPNEIAMVGMGFRVQIPKGYALLLLERSSMHKFRIDLANGVGLIDSDYTGEVKILIENKTDGFINIQEGTRLVQLVPIQVPEVTFDLGEIDKTERGSGGIGSTGL
jgi:dUTP pyrophosphatase